MPLTCERRWYRHRPAVRGVIGVRCRLSVRRPNVHSWPIRRSPRPHRSGRLRPEQPPPPRPPPRRPLPRPLTTAPSTSALRRALRRVRDGVALDVTEASVLLAARGEQLDELLAAAARVRDAGWSTPAVRAWSPTPARCSCRSRGCAATAATTAPSPPCRTACLRRSSSATRCWRSPAPGPPPGARRRCSPSATGPRSAGPPRASGWRPAATTPRWSTCARARSPCWRRPACCRTSTPVS